MAAWHGVQLILTSFMKGQWLSVQDIMQHLISPNSSLRAAFHPWRVDVSITENNTLKYYLFFLRDRRHWPLCFPVGIDFFVSNSQRQNCNFIGPIFVWVGSKKSHLSSNGHQWLATFSKVLKFKTLRSTFLQKAPWNKSSDLLARD